MSKDPDRTTSNPEQRAPILIATDFSPDSEAALIWAGEYSALTSAPLVVLHVVHDPADAAGFYRSDSDDAPEPMSDVAGEMMAAFLQKMRDEYPDIAPIKNAEIELVTGLPPGRIVEVAKREGARLIVIGNRGLSGLTSILESQIGR